MNKKMFLITGVLLSVSMTYGQVAIGSPVPRGALDINKKDGDKYSNDMGLVLPTNAAEINIKNAVPNNAVAPGTIFYDSTKDCVRLKQLVDWSDCIGNAETSPLGVVQALDCNNATIQGTFAANVYTYGTFKVAYTGGNGKSYPVVSVNSLGVTGLTATLAPGTFENGNGELTFVVSGIPSGAGTAVFVISVGGQTCQVVAEVVNKPATGGASDYVRWATSTNNSILHKWKSNNGSDRFTNQVDANYGPAGIKKIAGIFRTPLASGPNGGGGVYDVFTVRQDVNNTAGAYYTQVRDNTTGKKLRSSFDILEIGHHVINIYEVNSISDINNNDFETISEFAKEGGVVIIALDNGLTASKYYLYKNYLLNKFGMVKQDGNTLRSFSTTTAAAGKIMANFPGSDQNFGSVAVGTELENAVGPTILQFGYKISELPEGSIVYAVNKAQPDFATIWTLGGEYEGRVIFVGYGYFRGVGGSDTDLVIDTPQEKFMHNLVAYAMDKSKGL